MQERCFLAPIWPEAVQWTVAVSVTDLNVKYEPGCTSSVPSSFGSCSSVFSSPSQLTEFVAEELLDRREVEVDARDEGTLSAREVSISSSSMLGNGSQAARASDSRTVTMESVGRGICAGSTSAMLRA